MKGGWDGFGGKWVEGVFIVIIVVSWSKRRAERGTGGQGTRQEGLVGDQGSGNSEIGSCAEGTMGPKIRGGCICSQGTRVIGLNSEALAFNRRGDDKGDEGRLAVN
jgi:hypothetical protein